MKKEEIERIIENNFARDPTPASLFQIREDIVRKVLERLTEEQRLHAKRDFLFSVAALEGKFNAFNFLMQRRRDGVAFNVAAIEQLLVLYENCQRLCEFLVDVYDRTPEYLRSRLAKDDLIVAAANLQSEREEAHRSFVENERYNFPEIRLETFRNTIGFTMLAVLGEELYCRMMAEVNDALAIVRAHPKCRVFFGSR